MVKPFLISLNSIILIEILTRFNTIQVKKIRLCPEANAFSVENEMLTPTFKKRRHNIGQKYKDVLNALYAEVI